MNNLIINTTPMAKRDYILRYLFIIRKLRNSNMATFNEISDFIEFEFDLLGDKQSLSRRTFQRDLNEIRTIFNIDIQCNSKGKYYIDEDENADINNRILEGFDLFNALSSVQKKSSFVLLEERCSLGTEHIYGLLHAIQNCFIVKFTHTKYWEDKVTQRTIKPYALKEFKGRWYVLSEDMGDKKIKTFGLDRISDLKITQKTFPFPVDFNPESYFKDCFGIITDETIPVEEIVLSFTEVQARYIKSFPLHHSQKEIEPINGEFTIKLKLRPSFDFIMELLSHGDKVRIDKPNSLKEKINEILLSSLSKSK